MSKFTMFVVAAAALTLFGVGGWAASTTNARVAPVDAEVKSPSILELSMRSGILPSEHYRDYSLVFTETDGGGW